MALGDITAFIALDENTALAGMPTALQCAEVRDAGYDAVVNLAPEQAAGALPDEGAIWAKLGLYYVNIPVVWTSPTETDLARFMAVMDGLAGRRIFVHCQANMRVTAFYAIYAAARLGWSRRQAQDLIDRVWKARPDYTMDEIWTAFVNAGLAKAG